MGSNIYLKSMVFVIGPKPLTFDLLKFIIRKIPKISQDYQVNCLGKLAIGLAYQRSEFDVSKNSIQDGMFEGIIYFPWRSFPNLNSLDYSYKLRLTNYCDIYHIHIKIKASKSTERGFTIWETWDRCQNNFLPDPSLEYSSDHLGFSDLIH
ncbi:hypothetical protein [La Joya virus]|uniref:Uncharacterized protein n=1 Tax=La Joya virus TaxID=1272946 RepID=A0A0D3R1H1_9RHAB|nr:hypothetical protein [La Joya virus]AJR28305.1 hypothetical protein [La Joya virus]